MRAGIDERAPAESTPAVRQSLPVYSGQLQKVWLRATRDQRFAEKPPEVHAFYKHHASIVHGGESDLDDIFYPLPPRASWALFPDLVKIAEVRSE
jgi:hypothetical protein